ncbi:MAG TPA: MFS transporter [Acidimicrobiales bacterium]|nr:MFS transporter [Acidimicrobiales bacterium]
MRTSQRLRWLWSRSLDHYPDSGRRYMYLGIVGLAAIVLYYGYYVPAAVTPDIIAYYHRSFPFFVYIVVVGNAVGAFASIFAGLGDRWGRANMVVGGLLISSCLVAFGLPNSPNLWVYAVLYSMLGFVEGICLVAIPALVRDFSPQLGRGKAMSFYAIGPVAGALVVAVVSSHTLHHLLAWQDQFIIAGLAGLGVSALAVAGLRELSPRLRDQLMVSLKDRALVEARAAGIDIRQVIEHPWRQMLHLDVIGSSIGISVFLVMYYTIIAFFVVYMGATFGYSEQRANSLGNWMWAFNIGSIIVIGVLSDRMRVRKPFMVVGALGAMVATVLFALRTGHPDTGYYTFVWIMALLAVFFGFVFVGWLAGFTETVERRNPALIATGLAVWGWILRIAVSVSFLVLPFIVTQMSPIVEHGVQLQAIQARYPAEVATLQVIDARTAAILAASPTNGAAVSTAVTEISGQLHVTAPTALQRLVAVGKVAATPQGKADLAYLQAYGPAAQRAQAVAPAEWRRWWWIGLGCQAAFLPFVFLIKGRWRPSRARRDEEEHERRVAGELRMLEASVRSAGEALRGGAWK